MTKVVITAVLTAIAGAVAYFLSPSYREKVAQRERDKIASEVAKGDEPAVNARIGRFRAIAPWVVLALLIIGGWRGSIAHRSSDFASRSDLRSADIPLFATEAQMPKLPQTEDLGGVEFRGATR